jgi:hypothetical protein
VKVQSGAVHYAAENEVMGDEDARTLCGERLFVNRIYPLLWSESPRLVDCRRCLSRRKRRSA